MMRLTALITGAVLLCGGCAVAQEVAESTENAAARVQDCARLVAALTSVQEIGTVDRKRAEAAAADLDKRVRGITSQDVRDAGVAVADGAQGYVDAVRRGDTTGVDKAQRQLTDALDAAAKRCSVEPMKLPF